MKRIENRQKPWQAKHVGIFYNSESISGLYQSGNGHVYKKRIIHGWSTCPNCINRAFKEDPPLRDECIEHCISSGQRLRLGVRGWNHVCPNKMEWKLIPSWSVWRPLEEAHEKRVPHT